MSTGRRVGADGPAPADQAALAAAVADLADRLRGLPQSRLERPPADRAAVLRTAPDGASAAGPSVADAARALAQALADAAAGVEHRDDPAPPPRREVPRLGVFAVGDQVAVTGTDLVTAAAGLDRDTAVWAGASRARLRDVVAAAAARIAALRAQA